MKKLVIFIVLLLFATGCTNTTNLNTQIADLKKENATLIQENFKISSQLSALKTELESLRSKEAANVSSQQVSATQVNLNEPIVVSEYGEFVIKSAEFKQKIEPPNATGFYSYYEVKDPQEIYLDVVMEFKNTSTIGIRTDEITNIKVTYADTYEYSTFSALEESGGSKFTYTNINTVEPLKSVTLHHIATLPIEARDSGEPIKLAFTVYNSAYEVNVR